MIITLCCFLTGAMLFAYWFNYVIGSPLAEDPGHIDPGAIGAFIPRLLSRRRLDNAGRFQQMRHSLIEELKHTMDPVDRQDALRDFQRKVVELGRKLFTWERSFLCPVCLHWWMTLVITGLLFLFHIISTVELPLVGLIYLVNHLFIRKI